MYETDAATLYRFSKANNIRLNVKAGATLGTEQLTLDSYVGALVVFFELNEANSDCPTQQTSIASSKLANRHFVSRKYAILLKRLVIV